jgi:2-methylcitrate dehydratase
MKFECVVHGRVAATGVVRLFLDALACIYSGIDSEPVRLVERAVEQLGGHPQATLLTSGRRTSAEHAALVNGVALRFPDFNDIYYGPAWAAHPRR